MSATNKATHLGIERISTGNNRKELFETRITTARRTVFALMGAGLHGLNGVSIEDFCSLMRYLFELA
jgi:hypothetical protein